MHFALLEQGQEAEDRQSQQFNLDRPHSGVEARPAHFQVRWMAGSPTPPDRRNKSRFLGGFNVRKYLLYNGVRIRLVYLADEIAGVYRGMMIAIPAPHWEAFRRLSVVEFAALLRELASKVDDWLQRRGVTPRKPNETAL